MWTSFDGAKQAVSRAVAGHGAVDIADFECQYLSACQCS